MEYKFQVVLIALIVCQLNVQFNDAARDKPGLKICEIYTDHLFLYYKDDKFSDSFVSDPSISAVAFVVSPRIMDEALEAHHYNHIRNHFSDDIIDISDYFMISGVDCSGTKCVNQMINELAKKYPPNSVEIYGYGAYNVTYISASGEPYETHFDDEIHAFFTDMEQNVLQQDL